QGKRGSHRFARLSRDDAILAASDNTYYVDYGFALITPFASKISLTDWLQDIPAQTFEKPRRLFFHPFQFRVWHLALQFIPNCESSFQIGVAQECLRLLFGQGAIGYENFNQTTQDDRKGRKLAFDLRLAGGKQIQLFSRVVHYASLTYSRPGYLVLGLSPCLLPRSLHERPRDYASSRRCTGDWGCSSC